MSAKKKFISLFKAETFLMETLNKKQARLYNRLRQLVVECEFDFALAVTYLIRKERISSDLDSELLVVVNLFKKIHGSPDKHPSTLIETYDRVDADFITTTCRYYTDKKSKRPLGDRQLPYLIPFQGRSKSVSKPVDDRLALKDQLNYDVTRPLEIEKEIDIDIDKEIYKEKNKKEKTEKKSKKFIPPTLEQVRAYCQERKNNIDPEQFLDHYESVGWVKSSGSKVVNWQACVRTWEKNNFNKAPPKKSNSEKIDEYLLSIINGKGNDKTGTQ